MRKILLLGATSGIVQGTARYFAQDGDSFFLVGRNSEKLETVAKDLKVRGASSVEIFVADFNETSLHTEILRRAWDFLSSPDVILLGHGTLGDQKKCEEDFEAAEREIQTNFLSVASLLTHLANRLEGQKKGCLAVITSVAGDRGRRSNYVYGTCKGAVSIFLQGLRSRLDPVGVAVLTIKPGPVDTPMVHGRSLGRLWELTMASPEKVGLGIYRAILNKKDIVYLPWFWRWILLVVRILPESLFKKIST